MRVIFIGTPEFAVPTLREVLRAGHEVALVITQPDRTSGRGRRLSAPPVKTFAVSHAVPVLQVEDVNAHESLAVLRRLEPDVIVVAAFGQKLAPHLLEIPKLGCLNVHASLLPRYRGAAPVNRVILEGDDETGVTVIRMDEGLDTGDMLGRERVSIDPAWTAGDLSAVLAETGATLLVRVLSQVEFGAAEPAAQDASGASVAPMLRKRDGCIPWTRPAREVHNHIRGMTPWPGAFTFCVDGRSGRRLRLTVLASAVVDASGTRGEAGTVLETTDRGLVTACGTGSVLIREVKPAGGRAMSGVDFARGHAGALPLRFTSDA